MEPKDLKTQEGLKSTQKADNENIGNIPTLNNENKERVDGEVDMKNDKNGNGIEESNSESPKKVNEPIKEEVEKKLTDEEQGVNSDKSSDVSDTEVKDSQKKEDDTTANSNHSDSEIETEDSEQVKDIEEQEEQDQKKNGEVSSVNTEQQVNLEEKESSEAQHEDNHEENTGTESSDQNKDFDDKKIEKPVFAKKDKIDYSTYSQVDLVNALRSAVNRENDYDTKQEVEVIKSAFYRQVKEEKEIIKKQFLQDGGNIEDFVEKENPYEQDIKDLLKKFRQKKYEQNKKLEEEKEKNLQLKYDIIEEIKGLIHKEESINKTFQEFRDLQQRWREIGLVPQSKMKNLWDTYHFHVENFYDYIKINKELRDLDLKKNLEMKIKLCEQAEELLLEPNIIKAFNALQKLHERWREIGPVPHENKDDIWERFKASTSKINKKHLQYFENRKVEQKKNLEAKKVLCEQVEEINQLELLIHKDWSEKSKEVINLQKVWRTIGFAPRKDNNKIYKRFREACDKFFDAKRDFYSKNKELQQNNLQIKTDLCVQAEAIKDSTDWRKTTQDLINIQKQWKEIGPVPRKYSDPIWKRFRAACDYFFDRKSEYYANIDSIQADNLELKEKLIEDVENFEPKEDINKNLSALKEFQRRWTEIGHVPFKKKDEVQRKFRETIDKLFDDLNLDESKRNLLKFKTKIASFSETSRGQNKMRFERDKHLAKLKQLENDLVLLDNNIGFFTKSKNAESLINDVKRKIEKTKEKIEFLKNKIRVIDEMDQSDD